MIHNTTASTVRIISCTGLAALTTLRKIVATALAAKSGESKYLPQGQIVQVVLTPAADITYADMMTRDEFTLAANVSKVFPVRNALDCIAVKNAVTIQVEIYIETDKGNF